MAGGAAGWLGEEQERGVSHYYSPTLQTVPLSPVKSSAAFVWAPVALCTLLLPSDMCLIIVTLMLLTIGCLTIKTSYL